MKLSGPSASRQPTKCHDHLSEALQPLFATIVLLVGIAES
jgi:hypothetical protein